MKSAPVTITGVMFWQESEVNVPTFPSHPIAPGGPPVGIWPGPGVPTPPIYVPPAPPIVWPGPGTPGHPISGGGYVIGWSPVFGYVLIPIGGATPPTGEHPAHPIAGPSN